MSTTAHMQQVKASAGSGKTHFITQQFLSLLAKKSCKTHSPRCLLKSHNNTPYEESSWGDIMAITFTNLAATEMKERVLKSLKEIALNRPNSSNKEMNQSQAKAWVEIILRQYNSLNIRTIDSLLHLIVRTSALDLGLGPDFESSFAIQEVMDPIFDSLVEQAEYGDANVLYLLENICHSLLFQAEIKGFVIGSHIVKALNPLVQMLLTQSITTLSSKEDLQKYYFQLLDDFKNNGSDICNLLQEENINALAHANTFFNDCAQGNMKAFKSSYAKKSSLDECLPKASKGKASSDAEELFLKLLVSCCALQKEGLVIKSALQFYPFVEMAKIIVENINLFQDQQSKVAHVKMATLAQEILSLDYGVSMALCKLGNNLQHVLLDEFQDTSREQWDALLPLMVEALSHGGSLTWVGDVKQAIYGWRGGDAALFDEVCHTQELTCMASLGTDKLPTNWRSREAIVKFNNALFASLSNIKDALPILQSLISKDCPAQILHDGAQKLVTTFHDAAQKTKDNAQGGYICINSVIGDNATELEENIRIALQEKILNELVKRRSFGDIAILVRTNEHAALVASWLLQWQIPAITENSLLLHTHPLIQESLALLAFLHCPQDDLHFWILLSGKMLNLPLNKSNESLIPTISELQDFILQARENNGNQPLYIAFKERWPQFWDNAFGPFHRAAQLLSPYDCIQEWYRIWNITDRFFQEQTYLRRFLEILYGAEQQGHATLGTFLDYWAKEGEKEKAPTPISLDAVRILTVHKSKGLQFPVVIIPWTNFENKDNSDFIVQKVAHLNLLAPRTKHSQEHYYQAQMQGAHECLHVLYVACTRAQEELHIFHTSTKATEKRKNLSNALSILFKSNNIALPWKSGFPITKDLGSSEKEQTSDQDVSNSNIEEISSKINTHKQEAYPLMHWLPRLKIFRAPLQELLEHVNAEPKVQEHTRRGLLMHHCLEVLQKIGCNDKIEQIVHWGIQSFPLPINIYETLEQELIEALTWYANLPQANSWQLMGLPEQALIDSNGQLYRVDLLLPPHGQNGWRVIEFKTGQEYSPYITKLQKYLQLLDDMQDNNQNLPSSEGVLIYLDLQKCRIVQKNGNSEMLNVPTW